MVELPRGTVTLLFTDIEGSTRLLQELGREPYVRALEAHRRLLRAAFTAHGGVEVEMQGDSFHFAFPYARDAVAAAAAGQRALAAHAWEEEPIRVRIGLHTGEPVQTDGLYAGLDVHRAARIMSAGHGGQVIVSERTADLVEGELPEGVALRDLGEHRLKDLSLPQRLYDLVVDGRERDFPALASLYSTNFPVPATPFLGRDKEVAAATALLARDEVRLVTLVGAGGTGKTRLALQAAEEVADRFPAGLIWVALAPLADASLLLGSVARAAGIRGEPGADVGEVLATALAGRRCLLLLDNAEHLLPELVRVLTALRAIDGPTLLVTSRERLQVAGEHVFEVPTMADPDAVALFTTRARALGAETLDERAVTELCNRLDNLPLALELAAARTVIFSPEQLLQRLAQRLDLLVGSVLDIAAPGVCISSTYPDGLYATASGTSFASPLVRGRSPRC